MLSVDVRSKRFDTAAGPRAVIKGLAFDVGAREIVALVGPSGCGKTTLLKIIGGLDRGYDGSVGWRPSPMPRIGTVFQEPRLLPWRSVADNLALVDAAGDGTALLDALGLWAFRGAWASSLSLGMARRLAIARALAIEPGLLLLDEPFVSLDAAMAARCRQLLLDTWRQRPTAVLLVTHDLAEAAALADRILLLSAGPARLIADIPVPADLRRAGEAAAAIVAAEVRRAS